MADHGLMLSLMGQFISLGGFEQIQKLVKIGAIGPNFKCPVSIICLALHTFTRIVDFGVQ
jgi:hypothetical protein